MGYRHGAGQCISSGGAAGRRCWSVRWAGCTASWVCKGAMLTDSGGYQAMSLAKINSIDESGIVFGRISTASGWFLTPESAIRDSGAARRRYHDGAGRMHRLSCRSCARPKLARIDRAMGGALARGARTSTTQALFGIVQGGVYPDLRQAQRRADYRAGVRRLRGRRPFGRRTQGADAGDGGAQRRAAAGG